MKISVCMVALVASLCLSGVDSSRRPSSPSRESILKRARDLYKNIDSICTTNFNMAWKLSKEIAEYCFADKECGPTSPEPTTPELTTPTTPTSTTPAAVMCTTLPEVAGGTIPAVDLSNATPGFTISYTCDRFFTQNGPGGTLTCTSDGNFTTPAIPCEFCTAFQYTITSDRSIDVGTFVIGSSITSQAACTQLCDGRATCQIPLLLLNRECIGIPASSPSGGACLDRCSLNPNCLSYAVVDVDVRTFQICLLSDLSLENLLLSEPTNANTYGELGDKVSCE